MEQADLAARIHLIRGIRVLIDTDLAILYQVATKALNQAVKRNAARFPPDFVFQLTPDEYRHYMPYAFTEHGAIMLASVLNSERAIAASIYVVRAFVQLRRYTLQYQDLVDRLAELENHTESRFREVYQVLKHLLEPPPGERKQVGFKTSSGTVE